MTVKKVRWKVRVKRRILKLLAALPLLLVSFLCFGMTARAEWILPAWMTEFVEERVSRSAAHRWREGDVVTRNLAGVTYQFRCIDENYRDSEDVHRPSALFLCDVVISADFGSRYVFEPGSDGIHDYHFYPGEIVNYGSGNDYKYSSIRGWLTRQSAEVAWEDAEPIFTGVSRAYSGRTPATHYEQLDGLGLSGSPIGYQKMTDKIFILSVDEAIRYRDRLWRFEGSKEENPESQYGEFCKGYWLRTPVGTRENHDTDETYVVDLLDGSIRPAEVQPGGAEQKEGKLAANAASVDEEVAVTATFGVRPAFALAQGID